MAGLRTAQALRSLGYDGDLLMIGGEHHAPYARPPLSKQVLVGEWPPDRTALQDDSVTVDCQLGVCATGVDLPSKTLSLDTGEKLGFNRLVLATGTRARVLPLCEAAGVHVLRTLDDAVAIRDRLDESPTRVVILGGGFIGTEVASSCRQRGLDVSIVEPNPHPLGGALGAAVSSCLAEHYRDHGVDLRFGVAARSWTVDTDGAITSLQLSDGSMVDCDLVVVAVGAAPNVGWLEGSGLRIDDGVCCDRDLLVAPGVVAVGDVARWQDWRTGTTRRIEHWDNAVRQARHAAATLLGVPARGPGFAPVPWVWSDQFGRKVQVYGLTKGHDEVIISAGSLRDRKFVALYRKDDHLCGALGVNMTRSLLGYRRLLEQGRPSWSEALALTRSAA